VSPPPATNYQGLFDSVGDRCYPGDQFPTSVTARGGSNGALQPLNLLSVGNPIRLGYQRGYSGLGIGFFQTAPQNPSVGTVRRGVSSAEDLSLLSDIEFAKLKNGELIVVGAVATPGHAFRPSDCYAVFHSIAGTEAPGVTIDPGPDPRLMQVRYFGGIQQTAMGNTFFEADRTLKLLSTGFDNTTCALWPERPRDIATELDLIGTEIGGGSNPIPGEGRWHRFWFEPKDAPIETEGSTIRIPKDRLVVQDTTGGGSFVVNNNIGGNLSVNVAGQSYAVAPGSSTIRTPDIPPKILGNATYLRT